MAPDTERDDTEFDEEGNNLTQQRTEEDPRPVDASWKSNELPEPEELAEPQEDTFSDL